MPKIEDALEQFLGKDHFGHADLDGFQGFKLSTCSRVEVDVKLLPEENPGLVAGCRALAGRSSV